MNNEDADYLDYLKAKRQANKQKWKNNYHYANPPCCLSCGFSTCHYEGDLKCEKIRSDRWDVSDVDDLGLCDQYKRHTISEATNE